MNLLLWRNILHTYLALPSNGSHDGRVVLVVALLIVGGLAFSAMLIAYLRHEDKAITDYRRQNGLPDVRIDENAERNFNDKRRIEALQYRAQAKAVRKEQSAQRKQAKTTRKALHRHAA
jgi:hypothetical protein